MRSRLYDMLQEDMGRCGRALGLQDVRDWQLAALNETMRRAKERSRFYKEPLADYGKLNNFTQLAKLPFTRESDLKNGLEPFLCISPDEVARIVTLFTSGSTDAPKRVAFSEDDIGTTRRFFRFGMQEMTGAGRRVMIGLPGTAEYGVPHLLAESLCLMGAHPLRYGAILDADDAVDFMRRHAPQCLVGLPVQMLGLAARVAALPEGSVPLPETVLLTADTVAPAVLRRIERDLQCRAFNHYGSTEMGYGGAVECCVHGGLHLRENDLYFEVVDPDKGTVLPPGCEGELVFTTLRRQAMPLIRYRTGDVARMTIEPCACGSPLPRISPPYRRQGPKGERWKIVKQFYREPDARRTAAFSREAWSEATRRGGRELNLMEMDEAVFAVEGIIDYRLRQDPVSSWQLEVWVLDEAQAGEAMAQLADLPLIRKLVRDAGLEMRPAPSGAARPCTLGKRLFA